jgi:phosphate starvation-inducible protein PhoH
MSKKQKTELINIKALNESQKTVLRSNKNMVLCGAAGTGKSLLAVYKAMYGISKEVADKLIIVRSAVPTREIGYLPGSLEDKVKVYEAPYEEIFSFLYDDQAAYRVFKNRHKQVEFMTSSYIRGITLEDAYIIVDEFQNMSFHELDSIITRLGENCHITFCGDIKQSDLKNSGLEDFVKVLKNMPEYFDIVEFGLDDIVRSGIVKRYLTVKEEINEKSNSSK